MLLTTSNFTATNQKVARSSRAGRTRSFYLQFLNSTAKRVALANSLGLAERQIDEGYSHLVLRF